MESLAYSVPGARARSRRDEKACEAVLLDALAAQTPIATQLPTSRKNPHAKPKNGPKGRKRASKGVSDSLNTAMPPNDSLDDILPLPP